MNMSLLQSWRWYGPADPVTLSDIHQAGASGVVSALHQIPHGEIWPLDEIMQRKALIEAAGLEWVVVESVPVHESIKTRDAECEHYLNNYCSTLQNLAAAGLRTVCYNFMPVLDWTRTDLSFELDNGAKALYFDWVDLAVFDLHVLKRKNASDYYSDQVLEKVANRYKNMSPRRLEELTGIIVMGVPTEMGTTVE